MKTSWKTTSEKHAKTCNVLPLVWAAIAGCKGEKTTTYRYAVGHFGRRTVEYACPTCKAAADISDSLKGPAYSAHLDELQAKAGVADYRTASVKRINGVPTLV